MTDDATREEGGETDEEPVAFNLSPERMTEIFSMAASRERTIVEFRTRETDDGGRELHSAMPITDHVEELEDQHDTTPPTHDD